MPRTPRCLGRLAAAFLLLAASRGALADVSFAEARLLPAGATSPGGSFYGVVSGDFDGDGRLDVAATGFGVVSLLSAQPREFVAIWLGNGDGTFQAPAYVDLGASGTVGAAGVVSADLDADGIADLAVAAIGPRAVLALRGNGDGTFGAPVTWSTSPVVAGSLQAGDLDGDGVPDLAVAPGPIDPSVTQIAVLHNDGHGGLGTVTLHTVARFPVDLVLADADGKDGLDILVACNSDQLSVLLNDGQGSFPEAATSYPVRIDARGLWAGDFDGDGKLDVAVAGLLGTFTDTCGGGCVVTVHGNGDGTFTAPPVENVTVIGAWPSRFFVAGSLAPDLDGDGRPDLFFPRAEGNRVFNVLSVLRGEPGGGFVLSEWVASPGWPSDPASRVDGMGTFGAVAGDLDGDGAPDLVVTTGAGTGAGTISLLPGLPARPGAFRAPQLLSLSRGWSYARGLALGRLDGDAALDLLAISDALDAVPGSGNGTFGAAFPSLGRVAGPGEFYNTLRVADLDGDGTLDALWLGTGGVQGGPPPRHLVALGKGDGTFQLVAALPAQLGGGANAAVTDLDGDGISDLAVLTTLTGGTVPYVQTQIEIWKNDGLGMPASFTLQSTVTVQPGGVFTGSIGLAAHDLDGDGRPDLVAHRANAAGGDDLLFFKGNGDFTFQAPQVVTSDLGATVNDVAVADVDEDGKRDLVIAWGSFATVLRGKGDGSFQPRTAASDIVSGIGTSEVRVADLDGDGHLDLVVGAANGPAWHRGDGQGGFGPPHHLAIGVEAGDFPFEIGDLDGDGLPDLVAGHPSGEPGVGPSFAYLTVLQNDSGPRAGLSVAVAGTPDPVHVAEPLIWTATVANHGPDAASGVNVRAPLRHGATFVSASASQGSCALAGGAVSCTLGSLASGTSATVTVRVTPTAAGPLWHGASASGAVADPDPSDDAATTVATVVAASADLSLTVTDAPDPVTAGSALTYTFTATNGGPSAATGVTFTDPLPAGTTLVSATPSAGSCVPAGGVVTCTLGSLAPAGVATVTLVVTPLASGSLDNAAFVAGAEADPVPSNDTAQTRTTVQAPPAAEEGGKGGGCGCGQGAEPGALAVLAVLVAVACGRRERTAR